jgi:predicted nucleotidyltransferase
MKPAALQSRSERAVAKALATNIQKLLGDDLFGIYLSGSAVTGGFDPGISDLDLVVVSARTAERIDLTGLNRMHDEFVRRRPDWSDRIEAVYVGRATLRSFRTTNDRLAVISPGEAFHLRDDSAMLWLQNWYLVREFGLPLVGPAASEVVPVIAWPEFVGATVRYAGELAARIDGEVSPGELAYALLTTCRASMTVRTDRHVSKQAAAHWVAERMPTSAWVVDAALRCRASRGAAGLDDPRTQAEARTLIRRLAAQIGQSHQPWQPASPRRGSPEAGR